MPPLNPYMIAAALVAAGLIFLGRGKRAKAADGGDAGDQHVYGHAPGEGAGGGGGIMGIPTTGDLAGIENGVQNFYDGSGYPDFGDSAPSTSDMVDTGPGGTQDPAQAAGAGSGLAGSSIPAGKGGLGFGGVSQPSAPIAAAIASSTFASPSGGYSGGFIPYNPSPVYVPGTSSAGGGGSTRI